MPYHARMTSPQSSQKRATLFGLATVLCWSTVATAFKMSLVYLTPSQLIFIATIVSALFLCLVLSMQGRLSELWSQKAQVYRQSFFFGLLNPTLYYLLLFWAYDLLPAQEAQAINFSWAIVMTFMAVPLLKQRLHWYDFLAAVFCYLGVCLIATRGDLLSFEFDSSLGVFLALMSTLVWSLYWILNRNDKREPVLGLCLNFLCALPVIVIFNLINGTLTFNGVPLQGLLGGVYVGLFEMGLAFLLWLSAMKKAENTARLANLVFITPFLSLFFISTFLGETILPSTFLGLSCIILGLVAQQWFSPKST